jgi:hypothetical protein
MSITQLLNLKAAEAGTGAGAGAGTMLCGLQLIILLFFSSL